MKRVNKEEWRRMASSGQIIVEALIAITLGVVTLLGIIGLLHQSLRINKRVTGDLIASYLASEGVEIVKSLLDTNTARGEPWNTTALCASRYEVSYTTLARRESEPCALTETGDPIRFSSGSGYQYGGGSPSRFIRLIDVSQSGEGDSITVLSTVSWGEGGEAKSVSLSDTFARWR